ncbi:MAG: hypothetical protein M3535_06305 [Actinomycetota bacterium]|nr:hypothetical protein [Actinomycetota bacterium]
MAALLAGTDDGLVEVVPDGNRAPAFVAGRSVFALAVGRSASWAIVDGTEVWRFEDGGWRLRAEAEGPPLTCLLPTAAGLLVGTAEAHLARLAGGRLEPLPSFDEVEGRDSWYTPWGGPADTRWLSAAADTTLYANVHVGGIVASTDGGGTWRQTGLDIDTDVHQVLAGAASGLVLAPCAEGLAVSHDEGDTWRIEDAGLHATYCRAVAVAGDTVVVSASSGPSGDRSTLYRRPLHADGPFERCRARLPEWFDGNIDTGCLAATGATVAVATPSGEVFMSEDQAATWRQLAYGLPGVHCLAFAP